MSKKTFCPQVFDREVAAVLLLRAYQCMKHADSYRHEFLSADMNFLAAFNSFLGE